MIDGMIIDLDYTNKLSFNLVVHRRPAIVLQNLILSF